MLRIEGEGEYVPYECRNSEAYGAGSRPLAVTVKGGCHRRLGLIVWEKALTHPISHRLQYHPPFLSLYLLAYCNGYAASA